MIAISLNLNFLHKMGLKFFFQSAANFFFSFFFIISLCFTDFILYPFILPLKNSTIHDEILFKNGRDEFYEEKKITQKISFTAVQWKNEILLNRIFLKKENHKQRELDRE